VTAHAEEAALVSLDAESELLERVRLIATRRDRLVAGLRDAGWHVPDAQGNFVWLPVGDAAVSVAAEFEEAGLIVRPFAGDGIRVSVGEQESVDKILGIAASIVRKLPEGALGRALT
jgi:histidinol-phosphate aminotransferase